MSVEDLRNYDLIVVMDRRNYIDVIDLARVWLLEEKVRRKLVLLLDANFRSRAGSKQSARHAGGGAGPTAARQTARGRGWGTITVSARVLSG